MGPAANRLSLREISRDRTLALMLGLAFGTGLPFLLVFSTQAARLKLAGIDEPTIGLISWVALFYSLKFLWAPVIDRVDIPLLARLLGRRRAWLLTAQCGVIVGLVGMGVADPSRSLGTVIGFAAFTAFAGATQDIVVDGWRIDAAPIERQGIMAATYQLGYRLALFSAGVGAFYIAEFYGWRPAYFAMAALMGVGIAAGLLAPRMPERVAIADATLDRPYLGALAPHRVGLAAASLSGASALCLAVAVLVLWTHASMVGLITAVTLATLFLVLSMAVLGRGEAAQGRRIAIDRAIVAPFADLAIRYRWWLVAILVLVSLYRLPDFLTGVMANPLYITLGFKLTDIANVTKGLGIWVGIAGAFAGGFAIARFGIMPVLLAGGIAAAASHLCLALLAASGHRLDLLVLSVCVESFAGSFAGTALIAFMSSLVSPAMAATQYALLSSLYALLGKLVGGFSGFAVKAWGYPTFFASTSTIGLPVAALCLLVWANQRRLDRKAPVAGVV